jgi:repressor of nif and glnA expression
MSVCNNETTYNPDQLLGFIVINKCVVEPPHCHPIWKVSVSGVVNT